MRSGLSLRTATKLIGAILLGVVVMGVPLSAPGYLSTPPIGARAWYWQHPSPQGNDVLDVSFVNGSTGWSVGRSGVILKTSDSGATWQHQRSNVDVDLYGVSFVSTTRGWAVGDNNTVLRTVDGGMTWVAQSLPGTAVRNMRSVAFFDENRGITTSTGGAIHYTADGGQSWLLATDPIASETLTDSSWSTASTAYVVGANGIILRSTNGGASWTQQTVNTNAGFNGVSFAPGTTTGYVVGNVSGSSWRVYRTTNGGTTWTLLNSSQPVSLFDVHALDASVVTVVGANGAVWRSANGGTSWTQQSQAQLGNVTLRAVQATSSTNTHVVGDFGQMLRTTNSGGTWSYTSAATVASLRGIAVASEQVQVAAGGSGTILRSADGGSTWTRQTTPTSSNLNDIVMPTSNAGWAIGDNGSILRTVNGGVTWTAQTGFVNQTLNAISATSQLRAVAVGDAGWAGITTNGGNTWVPTGSKVPGGATSLGVHMSGTTIWVASTFHSSGVLHRSNDSGTTWVSQPAPLPGNVDATDVYFLSDDLTGWATASNGAVLKTTNGGTTWSVTASGAQWSGRALRQVMFTDASTGIVVGNRGLIARTTDGGTTWSVQDSGSTYHALTDVAASGEMMWASGSGGAILRTTDQTVPVTSLSISPAAPNGTNSWYVNKPTVTLSATGAAATYYNWNDPDGPFWPYSNPLQADEGTNELHYYSVSAADVAEPLQSETVKVDTQAPTAPLSILASATSDVSIGITWSLASDPAPGSGVDAYRIFVGGSVVASVPASQPREYTLGGLSPNTTFTIRIVSVDAAGNVSAPSAPFIVSTLATQNSPLHTTAVALNASDGSQFEPDGEKGWYVTQPFLSLEATPSPVGSFTRYRLGASSDPDTYTAPIEMPIGDTAVEFYSGAPDRPDESTQTVNVKFDPIIPAAPSQLNTSSVTFNSVTLTWPPMSEPQASGIDRYEVRGEEGVVGSTSGTSYVVTGLSEQRTYEFAVSALSGAGLRSSATSLTVTTDSAPLPDPPTVVSATAPSGEFAFVNWMPPDNTVGAVSYRVWRSENGIDFSSIAVVSGSLSGSSYIDANVSSSTRYFYAVSTIDERGESLRSDVSESGWPWIAPVTGTPERPGGLSSIEGSGTIALTWFPATNTKVTGYYVLRADSSLGAVTTMTPSPVASSMTPMWTDTTAINGQPYWYSIRAVDESQTVGKPSIELKAESRSGYAGANAHVVGLERAACAKCHSVHAAPTPSAGLVLSVAGTNEVPLCLSCHSANSGQASNDTASEVFDLAAVSGTGSHGTAACNTCHRPHASAEDSSTAGLLQRENVTMGTGVCYSCHGADTELAYGDITVFEGSGHSSVTPPLSGSGVTCMRCHEPHTSRNEGLTRYEDFMQCMQCHTSAAVESAVPDVWSRLTLSDDPTSRHPILPSDRQAFGGSVTCQNCHNTHTATRQYPTVDPYDPSPAGTWTASRGDRSALCLACHDGSELPGHDVENPTEPWAPAVTGRGGVTSLEDIASTWDTSPHGATPGSSITTTTANLRPEMGYSYNDELGCRSCHQQHGSANSHMLRQDISSASGELRRNGIAVIRIPAGALGPGSPEGHDFRFLCNTCHTFNPASHDARAGIVAPASTAQFPYDCSGCHRHGSNL